MNQAERENTPSYIRWAGTVSVLTLVSRILGLVRDVAMAAAFGSSLILDAFLLAFTFPNLLRKIFGEGALTSAFVPIYSATLTNEGPEEAHRLAQMVGTLLVIILTGIVLLGVTGALGWEQFGAPSVETGRALRLSALMAPYLLLICLAAFLGSILNSHDRFFVPALSPVVFNLAWIVALVLIVPSLLEQGGPERAIQGLALAVLAGGLLQVAIQTPAVIRQIGPLRPRLAWSDPRLQRIRSTMTPILFGLAIFQVNILLDRVIAWWLVPDAGAITVLYLGNRLVQFPLALIALAIGTAIFPSLARRAAGGDQVGAASLTSEALRLALFLTIPAAAGLAILGTPICTLFFEHGEFTATASSRTGHVLVYYCLALPFLAAISLLTRSYHASGETRIPVRAGLLAVAVGLAANLALARPMGAPGLALATALAAAVNLAHLARHARSHLGALDSTGVLAAGLRALGLTAVAILPAAYLAHGIGSPILAVTIGIPLAILCYLSLAALTSVPEWSALFRRLRPPTSSSSSGASR